jgi:predicted HTH domain antitoxin
MRTIHLNIPESVNLGNEELKIFIAAKLFEAGKLTIVQASEMSGLEQSDFMKRLHQFDVSFFNYSASELETDVRNAKESFR